MEISWLLAVDKVIAIMKKLFFLLV